MGTGLGAGLGAGLVAGKAVGNATGQLLISERAVSIADTKFITTSNRFKHCNE